MTSRVAGGAPFTHDSSRMRPIREPRADVRDDLVHEPIGAIRLLDPPGGIQRLEIPSQAIEFAAFIGLDLCVRIRFSGSHTIRMLVGVFLKIGGGVFFSLWGGLGGFWGSGGPPWGLPPSSPAPPALPPLSSPGPPTRIYDQAFAGHVRPAPTVRMAGRNHPAPIFPKRNLLSAAPARTSYSVGKMPIARQPAAQHAERDRHTPRAVSRRRIAASLRGDDRGERAGHRGRPSAALSRQPARCRWRVLQEA